MKTTGLKQGQVVAGTVRLISAQAITLNYMGFSIKIFTNRTDNYQLNQKVLVKIERKSQKFFIGKPVEIKSLQDLINAFPVGSYVSGEIVEVIQGKIATIDIYGICCKHMLLPGMEIGQPVVCQIRDYNPSRRDLIVSAF